MREVQSLIEITPHVGTARDYLYSGASAERYRHGNCYAFHLFSGGGDGSYMTVAGRSIPIEKGTLVFIPPGVPHSFHVARASGVQSHNIYCDLWQTSDFVSDLPQFTFPPHEFRMETATLVRPCPELDALPTAESLAPYPHLFDNFAFISRIADQPRPYRQRTLDSLFTAWLLELHYTLFSHRPKDRRIVRILQEIQKSPERSASHEEWSRSCGLKKSYFYKLFKQETGMSLHEYVMDERLKKAAVMLQETSYTVTETAFLTGYSSVHHFSRRFTAKYGVSPSRYRK